MNLYDVITLADGRSGTIVDILSETVFAVEFDDGEDRVETVRANDRNELDTRLTQAANDASNREWRSLKGLTREQRENLLFVPDDAGDDRNQGHDVLSTQIVSNDDDLLSDLIQNKPTYSEDDGLDDAGDDLQTDLEHDDYNDGGKRRWPRSFTERSL